jgi:hypothetical protein
VAGKDGLEVDEGERVFREVEYLCGGVLDLLNIGGKRHWRTDLVCYGKGAKEDGLWY